MEIDTQELSDLISIYLREEYDFDYLDNFGDEIVIYTHDNKVIDISLDITITENESKNIEIKTPKTKRP